MFDDEQRVFISHATMRSLVDSYGLEWFSPLDALSPTDMDTNIHRELGRLEGIKTVLDRLKAIYDDSHGGEQDVFSWRRLNTGTAADASTAAATGEDGTVDQAAPGGQPKTTAERTSWS